MTDFRITEPPKDPINPEWTGELVVGNGWIVNWDLHLAEHSCFNQRLKSGVLMGEICNPSHTGVPIDRFLTIDASRVSHQFTNIWKEGDKIFATVKPAGPHGEMLKEILEKDSGQFVGRALVNRSRELGDDVEIVHLITFDLSGEENGCSKSDLDKLNSL